ncbi:MAG: hypothetical protein R3F59_09570 [Myxococcota bacterium]
MSDRGALEVTAALLVAGAPVHALALAAALVAALAGPAAGIAALTLAAAETGYAARVALDARLFRALAAGLDLPALDGGLATVLGLQPARDRPLADRISARRLLVVQVA